MRVIPMNSREVILLNKTSSIQNLFLNLNIKIKVSSCANFLKATREYLYLLMTTDLKKAKELLAESTIKGYLNILEDDKKYSRIDSYFNQQVFFHFNFIKYMYDNGFYSDIIHVVELRKEMRHTPESEIHQYHAYMQLQKLQPNFIMDRGSIGIYFYEKTFREIGKLKNLQLTYIWKLKNDPFFFEPELIEYQYGRDMIKMFINDSISNKDTRRTLNFYHSNEFNPYLLIWKKLDFQKKKVGEDYQLDLGKEISRVVTDNNLTTTELSKYRSLVEAILA